MELAIATDFAGESTRLEDIEDVLKKISEAGLPMFIGAMNGREITYTPPMKCSRLKNGWISII